MQHDRERLHDTVSELIGAANQIEDVAVPILRAIGDAFGWDVGFFWITDRRAEIIRCVATWHTVTIEPVEFEDVSRRTIFPVGAGLPGQVWTSREPVWIPDLRASRNFPRLPLAADAGLQSGFAFPIVQGRHVLGVIEFFGREQRPPRQEVFRAVATLGQQIGQFLERGVTERALRESDAHTAAVLASALDAIVTIDHNDRIMAFNPAAERLFGYAREDVMGQPMGELLVPVSLREAHYAGLARYLTDGNARVLGRRIDITAMRADGSEFPVELSITRVADVDPPVFTGYIRDLTEQRRVAARQRFLAEASEILASSLDYDDTLAHVARLAVPFVADWCVVYLQDAAGCIQRVAVESASQSTAGVAQTIREGTRINPDAPVGVPAVIRSGRSVLHTDATTALLVADVDDPEALWPTIDPLGVCSWMCVPLSAHDQTFGAMSFISTTPGRRYHSDDLQIGEELAHRAALAIDHARLYRAAQAARNEARAHAERVEALATASRAFAETSLELQPLFETIVDQIVALTGGLCIIRLLSDDGTQLDPVAVGHPNPEAADFMRTLLGSTTYEPTEGLLGQVIHSRSPVLIPFWTPAQTEAAIKMEFWPYVERFGLHSLVIVPLIGRGTVLGTLAVFRDEPGRPFTLADQSFLQDLAGRAALALENARLYRNVRETLAAREAFVSIAAHELRTPLTTIKAFGQMLARELQRPAADTGRLGALTDRLQGQIERLAVLVEDLLDASRLQQPRVAFRREPVELVELARDVLERFEHDPNWTNKHTLVLDALEPIEGVWDAGRLDQVITNLVSNALKYSPAGGEVRVALRERDGQIELVVGDQGLGIPAEDRPQLFQPFARGNAGMHGIPGTGLGLYVTAQIVERYGGTIRVESEPGKGSRFIVILPRGDRSTS